MLFSSFKWNGAEEISPYVPASKSLSFQKMEHALLSVETMFLYPVLGEKMLYRLQKIYDGRFSSTPDVKEKETVALDHAKRAEANLAFWFHFDALNLRISDQGFQRQQSDEWVPAYKYQEDRMRDNYKTVGFNTLDTLLDYLQENSSIFTEFKDSPAYRHRQTAEVKNRAEAERYVYLANSYISFLRLAKEFPMANETDLKEAMGGAFHAQYIAWLANPDSYPQGTSVTLEQLRQKCVPVIVFSAARRLVERTGTLADQGLYFEAVVSSSSVNNTRKPATDNQIGDRLAHLAKDILYAQAGLKSFLRENYTELYADTPGNIMRDNNDRTAFFAM